MGAGATMGIGLVGCGYVARERHLPALARLPEAEVVAVCDADPAAAARVASQWEVPRVHASAEELVADPRVEAVGVCVPVAAHVEVVLAALAAGKHVLVEKPLALSLPEADRVIGRAEGSGLVTAVGFNLRWHRSVRLARERVRSGELGRIRCVRTMLAGGAADRSGTGADWGSVRALGGGSFMERAVHHFDLWRLLAGDEVEEVAAVSASDEEDDALVSVSARMTGGVIASGVATGASAVANRVEVHGDRGALDLSLYRVDGLAHSSLEDLPGAVRTRLKRARETIGQIGAGLSARHQGGVYNWSFDAQWRHFVHCVRTGTGPECGFEDGRRALAVALAAAESATTGRRVRVEDAPAELPAVVRA